MVANANSLSFTSESNTLTPHKSFPGTDSPSTRRWWKPLRGRFVYFGALRETNCGSKVKLLESLGSQKIRKFLERWKNRLEKLDIESSLLPVVHGRREKDLIMWNVACYVHSFENKVIVLPFTDIIFLSPGPPTLPYFDTFIFQDVLDLVEVRVNCEQNSLLYLVRPRRTGACHTKDAEGATRPSCYYRKVTWTPQEKSEAPVTEVISKCTTLEPLWCTDAPEVKRVSNQLAKSSLKYSSGKKGDLIGARVCVGIELCQKYISVYSESVYTYLSIFAFRSCAPWKADALPSLHVRSS